MIAAIGAFVALLILLFLVWRVRYRYPPPGLPQVLCYHKLSDRFCFEGTWTTRGRFLDQIDRLIGAGYRFIDEDEYLAALEAGPWMKPKDLLLTFDDGYEALCDVYLDELAPRGIPVLVFLVAGFAGRDNTWDLPGPRRRFKHLSWPQVEMMASAGASFGSHGMTHLDLTRARRNALEVEIAGSKAMIEAKLGAPVRSFSYPFGRYSPRVRAAVKSAGYKAAFSLYPGHSNEFVDRFALRRNGVYIIDTFATLRWKLERTPFSWFEEMKCRAINGVAVLTPILKRRFSGPGR